MRYSVDVFLEDQILSALETDNLPVAYKKFAELLDLVEMHKLDTVAIFDNEIDAPMKIIAQVSSFDF